MGNVLLSILALSSIIVIIDFTCRKVRTINIVVLMMMQAAYAVYIIHPIVLSAVMGVWIYILRHGFGIDVQFEEGTIPESFVSETPLSGGLIFLGWVFIVILTEAIVWPLSFFIRKLPVLNQMI